MIEANSSHELGNEGARQKLIDIFVNAVYLYDGKLVIAFDYKEATKTLTLKEVNGSIIECSSGPGAAGVKTCRWHVFILILNKTL